MNGFNRFLVAAFMMAAMLLPNVAQAMTIQKFDKMADQDQAAYVGLLVQRGEDLLTDEGRSDLQEKMHELFSTIPAGDKMSFGMTEFVRNLALARVADAERAAQDPSAHRLEVEDAMLVTLKKNNIPLSQDFIRGFRAINGNFHPKFPPQSK